MTQIPEHLNKPTVGYSTDFHLLLDLDQTTPVKVERLLDMLYREYRLTRVLVVLSSVKSTPPVYFDRYNAVFPALPRRLNIHLVFDDIRSYDQLTKICITLAVCGVLNEQYEWIRQWRGDLTLRISPRPLHVFAPTPLYFLSRFTQTVPLNILTYLETLRLFNPVANQWLNTLSVGQRRMCYRCLDAGKCDHTLRDTFTALLDQIQETV
jgi:hypothetical protein